MSEEETGSMVSKAHSKWLYKHFFQKEISHKSGALNTDDLVQPQASLTVKSIKILLTS